MTPLVTMIVPGRDVAAFAPAALASLQAQTEARWHALLVDGGYLPGRVQPRVAAATTPRSLGTTLAEHPDASANIVAWSKLSRAALQEQLRFPENVAYEDQVVAQRMNTEAPAFDVIRGDA